MRWLALLPVLAVLHAPVAHAQAQAAGRLLQVPETIAPGQVLNVTLALGEAAGPEELRVTVYAADGSVLASRDVTFDPDAMADPPGCDPMPGWTHPCSREPRAAQLSVPFAGALFTTRGVVRVTVRSRSGTGWSRVIASATVRVARD